MGGSGSRCIGRSYGPIPTAASFVMPTYCFARLGRSVRRTRHGTALLREPGPKHCTLGHTRGIKQTKRRRRVLNGTYGSKNWEEHVVHFVQNTFVPPSLTHLRAKRQARRSLPSCLRSVVHNNNMKKSQPEPETTTNPTAAGNGSVRPMASLFEITHVCMHA